MKEGIKNTLTLSIIMVAAALLLSLTNSYTRPIIEKNQQDLLMKEIQEIFQASVEIEGKEDYMLVSEQGSLIGYAAQGSAYGYSSDIKVLVGVDTQGRIVGVEVLEHQETPGLGSKVTRRPFLQQFKDMKEESLKVDAITGATISSSATIEAVSQAMEKIE